jgi:hypothetical protein
MAVAKFESTPSTPSLARIAVAAAKQAERSDQKSQFTAGPSKNCDELLCDESYKRREQNGTVSRKTSNT